MESQQSDLSLINKVTENDFITITKYRSCWGQADDPFDYLRSVRRISPCHLKSTGV